MTPYTVGQTLYRASVKPGAGRLRVYKPDVKVDSEPASDPEYDPRIWFDTFTVVRVTPKGAWVLPSWRVENTATMPNVPRPGARWVSLDGRFCSATKERAVQRLKARTRAYLRHARHRLKDAVNRAHILGVFDDGEEFWRNEPPPRVYTRPPEPGRREALEWSPTLAALLKSGDGVLLIYHEGCSTGPVAWSPIGAGFPPYDFVCPRCGTPGLRGDGRMQDQLRYKFDHKAAAEGLPQVEACRPVRRT